LHNGGEWRCQHEATGEPVEAASTRLSPPDPVTARQGKSAQARATLLEADADQQGQAIDTSALKGVTLDLLKLFRAICPAYLS
jgi:hypothetical protein